MTLHLAAAPPWREGLVQTLVVVAALAVVWLVFDRLGRRYVRRATESGTAASDVASAERAKRLATLWAVVRAVVMALVLASLVLLLFDVWGVPIAPLLAVGSVVGVAVGFGAQDLVKNVIAGFFVVVEDQYAIGDVVSIAGTTGAVESIRFRTTVLRDLDGNVHHVPNGAVTVASNYTQAFAQVVVDVGVSYEEDIDRVIAVVLDEGRRFAADEAWAPVFLAAPEMLGVDRYDPSAIVVRLLFKVHPDSRWTARREFLLRLKRRFDAEGIAIAYPALTLFTADRAATALGDGPPPA